MEATGLNRENGLPLVVPRESSAGTAIACRTLDLVLSIALLIALSPLFALVALLIWLDSPGPVLFRQRRCGLSLAEFTMNKFRTMHQETSVAPHREYVLGLIRGGADRDSSAGESSLFKLEEDDRVTRVGRTLRRFSLDELPQLVNVVRGEMSLVGPRPSISYEVDAYPPEWYKRFTVKPGITGLWQVSGRSRLNLEQMVRLDLEYAELRSFRMNVRIIAKTAWVVLDGKGAA